jgi:diguanylate cyclase (GGDEF)-like protein/hemerythrin-like metal-binding protein/PAS domain S-box-containing protein
MGVRAVEGEAVTEVGERGFPLASLVGLLVEPGLVGFFAVTGDRFAYVNARAAQVLGYDRRELEHARGPVDLAALQDRAAVAAQLERWRAGADDGTPLTFLALRRDGSFIDVELCARGADVGGARVVIGVVSDVSERVRAERQLRYLAFYDSLTGLPNRALFFDRLTQAVQRARRYGERFALMLLDLDGFKAVNDSHGHETGDTVLRVTAQRLLGCVRQSDTVARMGGDEITVLLNQARDPDALRRLAQKVVDAVGSPVDVGGGECRVGASVGVACFPDHGQTPDALLASADAAMYASKQRGKGMYTVFEPGVLAASPRETSLIEWSSAQELGIEVIDRQHRRLTELVNALARRIGEGQDAVRVQERLTELVAFADLHFRTEEELMDAYDLPGAAVHKQEHRRLLGEIDLVSRELAEHGLSHTLVAVKDWLLAHMSHSDRALAAELRARGLA